MREWIALLLLLPLASGLAWEDPADDQEMGATSHYADGTANTVWAPAAGNYPYLDVVSATFNETETSIYLRVEVKDIEKAATEPKESTRNEYRFHYTLSGRNEAVGFAVQDGEPKFARWMQLYFFGKEYWGLMELRDADVIDDAFGWEVYIPKSHFLDANSIPVRKGTLFENLRFESGPSRGGIQGHPCLGTDGSGIEFEFCELTVRDQITSLGDFAIEKNPPGIGHLYAQINAPYRLSNGLATTYTYQLQVTNLATEPDTLRFTIGKAPLGWQLFMPPTTTLAPDETRTLSVAMTVPFTHEHGRIESASFRVESELDRFLDLKKYLYIGYPEPAQPGGHHPELYFHSSGSQMWMHTDPTDAASTDQLAYAEGDFFKNPTNPTFRWHAQLEPALGLGMDFEPGKNIVLDANLDFRHRQGTPIGATIRAELYLLSWANNELERTTIGFVEGGATLEGSRETNLELLLPVTVDRLPFEPNRNLMLDVNVTLNTADSPARVLDFGDNRPTWILEGSKMTLPSVDYHDDVDWSAVVEPSLSVHNLTATARPLNAGNTTAVVFEIRNLADEKQQVSWQMQGSNTNWATLTPDTNFIAANSNATLVVRLSPPANAIDGQAVDLLLIGTGDVEPISRVFVQVYGLVTESVNVPDESAEVDGLEENAQKSGEKATPLPFLLLLAAVFFATLLAKRRTA